MIAAPSDPIDDESRYKRFGSKGNDKTPTRGVRRGSQPTKPLEDKAERWKRLADSRGGNVIKALINLRKLADREFYEYSQADVDRMFGVLDREYSSVKESFKAGKEVAPSLFDW